LYKSRFPLGLLVAIDQENLSYPTENNMETQTETQRRKILIIDDSKVMQQLISSILTHFNDNLEVLTSDNGEEGIEKATEEQPYLILVDMVMPKMGGFETWKHLKSREETLHIPVVMLKPRDFHGFTSKNFQENGIKYIDKTLDDVEAFSKIIMSGNLE
jgi:CheY-like chemotaxis protein